MMRVYVAGSVHEIPRVREVMDAVRARGHQITFDWTEDAQQSGLTAASLTTEERAVVARKDFAAVAAADAVIVLVSTDRASRGACMEFAYAYAHHKPIVLAGPPAARRATIFFDLATRQYDVDAAAVAALDDVSLTACPHCGRQMGPSFEGNPQAWLARCQEPGTMECRSYTAGAHAVASGFRKLTDEEIAQARDDARVWRQALGKRFDAIER